MRKAFAKRRGFTLIELMVVIAIVGVLASFALPSLRELLVAGRVRGASSDFYAALLMARSEAIKRRTNAVVSPVGADWSTGWTVTVGASTLQSAAALPSDVAITIIPAGNTPVTYSMNGRVASGAQTVRFSSASVPGVTARCVALDANGLPRVRVDVDNESADGCS